VCVHSPKGTPLFTEEQMLNLFTKKVLLAFTDEDNLEKKLILAAMDSDIDKA
jgi:hypothetical protein